jgi:hypothetical protein
VRLAALAVDLDEDFEEVDLTETTARPRDSWSIVIVSVRFEPCWARPPRTTSVAVLADPLASCARRRGRCLRIVRV